MDYSKCNFVSAASLFKKQGHMPIMRVNIKNGFATLSQIVNEGLPFALVGIDESRKAVRVQMSEKEGFRVNYESKTCHVYLPKAAGAVIIDGFNSAKSKVINLERGNDGAWYGKY